MATVIIILLLLYLVIGLAAFMRGQELSTLVVILSVCHNGKSLSGHQT